MGESEIEPRLATPDDADEVAQLLDAFNREFDTPTPGPTAIAPRIRELLAGPETFVVLVGEPSVGLAVVTLRPNVWYQGPVGLLDELYVAPAMRSRGIGTRIMELVTSTALGRHVERMEINVDEGDVDAQRFYERLGYSATEPDTGERAFYYARELPTLP